MGFALTVDPDSAESSLLVAVPPRIRLTGKPKELSTRRLYTIEDIRLLMRKSCDRRFRADNVGTHLIYTKSTTEMRFCGPLQLVSLPVRSCTTIPIPNPFELDLFFEANAVWPALLKSIHNSDFDTNNINPFDSFNFLSATYMQILGHRYANQTLQVNDRVHVTILDRENEPMTGAVQSLNGEHVSVYFPSTGHRQLISREQVIRIFEPLDLVEVYLGRHVGLRGMVMLIDCGEAFVQDEKDVNTVVSYASSLGFLLLICMCQVPVYTFCLRPRADGFHGSRPVKHIDLSIFDVSRPIERFGVGDWVRIKEGSSNGWLGTVVWVDWDGACHIWKSLLPQRTPEEWLSWCSENGYTTIDLLDPCRTSTWRTENISKVTVAYQHQLAAYEEVNALRSWTRRDFLINKRVIVTGAHECKGMKGWVVDVNIALRTANVSLDAHTLFSNKFHAISLGNLMLDLSKDE